MSEEEKIEPLFVGRKVLQTVETKINSENLLKVLERVLPTFEENQQRADYLYQYFKGNQPILQRVKKFRKEINNKVVENHAHEIVSFKKAYVFGEPVQYIRRAIRDDGNAGEDDKVGESIRRLNEMMACEDKPSQDLELAEWMFITGTAYRMALPKQDNDGTVSPIEMETEDPRYTAVVYNTGFGRKPVMSIKQIKVNAEDDRVRYCIYTPTDYYEVEDNQIIKAESHALHAIPIIEYPANNARLGAFELVLGLLDAINKVGSNRLDGIEQFIQSFMKFVNVRIDKEKYDEFVEKGVLMFSSEPGNPADVAMLTSEMDQSQTQIAVDHYYQMILTICGMPDRNGTNRTTGDTGQAVMLRDGWSTAESNAKEIELMFKKSEKQFLKYILNLTTDELHLSLADIDIKFTRNKTDNLLTKTQGLQNMLEAGVDPYIAFSHCNLFSDPEQACKDSEPYLKKWLSESKLAVTPANNKPNPAE